MQLADLPSRRAEAWKWTDLRAAMSEHEATLTGSGPVPMAGPVFALAELFGDSYGPGELIIEKSGEVFESKLANGDASRQGRITVRSGVAATLVERMAVTGSSLRPFLVSHARIEIEPGAKLDRVIVQENAVEGADGVIALNEAVVKLAPGATFRQVVVGEGARLTRIETSVEVAGEGVQVEMNGLYLASAGRHIDLTSRVTHDAAGAHTRQLVRGAARKGGRGVFQGKFLVARAGQKTDAAMQHNALLLEEGAEVFAKPELEIYADDVACAHGNTCGRLDENAIFYLRQRGLPEAEARAMVTRAFLIEAVPAWLGGDIRAEIEARIDGWLGVSA